MTGAIPSGPVVILAGSGALPGLIADQVTATGGAVRILAFRGFADSALRARADAVIGLLDLRAAIARLDEWRPAAVVLAGGVSRPSPTALLDAFSLLRGRDEVARVIARGDDNLLRGVISLLEERGHRLVGIPDLAPALLAGSGVLGKVQPGADDRAAIRTGLGLLSALSPFDVGQAAVIRGERVVAIEGPEGTDRMLRRAARLAPGWPLRRGPRGGVMVKAPKHGQDLRVDLPAIGPRTVVHAARAGLAGIAVGTGLTLVIERERTIAEADRRGLFLVGVEPELPS